MKKVGLLTFFESDNYGTVLQAYATSEYLRKLDCDCELVWIKRNVHARGRVHSSKQQELSFPQRLIAKYEGYVHRNDGEDKKRKFAAFRRDNMKISSKMYEDDGELQANPPMYDIYISGGDQIWNPHHKVFSYHYMWDFLPEDKKIVAYGSSFGISSISDQKFLNNTKRYLSKFSAIGVREKSGVEILKSIDIEAENVVDPVFLLSDEWKRMVKPSSRGKRYIFVYALIDYSQEEQKQIRAFAKRKKLDIVVLPDNRMNRATLFKKEFALSPEEFVSMLANAEYVFTNSFHGLAFSIIFKKRFALLSAATEEGKAKRVRLTDMLASFGIGDCTIDNIEDGIDYEAVGSCLDAGIEKSKKFLNNIINQM